MISRNHRIAKRFFVILPRTGTVVYGQFLTFRVYAAADTRYVGWKAAVVVSKKVAPHAVSRNRIRRQVFELLRTQLPTKISLMIVVFPKKEALAAGSRALLADVVSLVKAVTIPQ